MKTIPKTKPVENNTLLNRLSELLHSCKSGKRNNGKTISQASKANRDQEK